MTTPPEAAGGRVTAIRHTLIEVRRGETLPPLPKAAWLEIDLDALIGNVRLLRGLLPAGVRIEPVVKADAYGHGAVPVARALVADGMRSLSVATFDEALELREAGIEVPILILFPIPPELAPDARRHCLSVTAGDQVLLERTLAALANGPRAGQPASGGSGNSPLAIHLEVETGLGRGGCGPGSGARCRRGHRGLAARPPGRPVVASPGRRQRRPDGRPGPPLRRRRRAPGGGRQWRCRTAISPPAAASWPPRPEPTTSCGSGWPCTASCRTA